MPTQPALTRRRPPAVARPSRLPHRATPIAGRAPGGGPTASAGSRPIPCAGSPATARAALGPATGPDLVEAVLPALLVVLLSMAAVLRALHRLARGDEDPRPIWLIGLATLMLAAS